MNNSFYRGSRFSLGGGGEAGASVQSPSGAPAVAISGVVTDTRLAELMDEGANASRAAELSARLDGTLISLEDMVIRAEQNAPRRRQ